MNEQTCTKCGWTGMVEKCLKCGGAMKAIEPPTVAEKPKGISVPRLLKRK